MEKVDFIQKPVELAQSSQHFIENLWEIVTEVSKLYAPLTSVFSYFFGFIVNTISYQSNLYRSIQEFTLTRVGLLFPYYLETEGVTLRGGEYFPAQTEKLTIPILLNLSVVRAVSKVAVPLAKKPGELATFPKPQEPEITGKISEKQLAEVPQETLIQRITEVQTQLWSRLTPSMKNLSSTLIEYERQAIPITFLAAASKPVLLNRTVFAGLTPYRFVTPLKEEKTSYPEPLGTPIEEEKIKPSYPEPSATPLEEKKVKPSFPEPPSKEVSREPPLDKALMVEAVPFELTGGITLGPKTLRVVGYATKLPTAISEKQTTFLKSVPPISRSSTSPPATSLSVEPASHYAGTVPETPTPMPPSHINLILKKISIAFTSWMRKGSVTLHGSRVSLSALPIAASAVEKLVSDTIMQPISSLEAPRTYEAREPISQSLTPSAKFKPEVRHASVEAFRLPSILTSRMAYHTHTYPWLPPEPAVSHTYKTPFEVERLTSEKPTTPSEKSETQKPSKLPITLALAATEKLLTQRRQQESAAFMKKIQISRSTYARAVAEVGAAGPIRTTMLDELAVGLTIPYTLEPYTPQAETVSQQQLIQRSMSPTSQDTINVNVFADTDKKDLKDLERKIRRILSEQISRYYGSSII